MICTATLVGHLTKDPEVQTIQKGSEELTLTKFSLAVNHGFGDDAEVSYFDFVAWNGLGKSLAQYRRKGDQVGVVAEPRQSRWSKDGQNRSKVEFVAKTIEFLRSKGDGNGRADEVPVEVVAASAPTSTPDPAQPEATPVEAPAETPAEQTEMPVPF